MEFSASGSGYFSIMKVDAKPGDLVMTSVYPPSEKLTLHFTRTSVNSYTIDINGVTDDHAGRERDTCTRS